MAQQLTPNDPNAPSQIAPARYSEQRTAQFVGGSVDPQNGNVTDKPSIPKPDTPSTRLGEMAAEPPSLGKSLTGAAVGAGSQYAGTVLGGEVGAQMGAGVGAGQALSNTASGATHLLTSPTQGTLGAAPSAMAGAGLGGAVGSGVGAGLGTLIAGAATQGGNFFENMGKREVYQPAIGSAIGTTIGTFIAGPIGGLVGGFVGSMFCHAGGTMIRMADGSRRAIETLKIGDEVLLGGRVLGRGEVEASDLYAYRGTLVTGMHAVFESGSWVRVKHSKHAVAIEGLRIVYPIVTEAHLLVCEGYICADVIETDEGDIGADAKLITLNDAHERNSALVHVIRELEKHHGRASAA